MPVDSSSHTLGYGNQRHILYFNEIRSEGKSIVSLELKLTHFMFGAMCTVECSGAINVTFGANEEAPLFELQL